MKGSDSTGIAELLVVEAVESAPEPRPEVIEANPLAVSSEQTAVVSGPTENNTVYTDKSGVTFDPSIHCQNADGTPKRTTDGNFRKKPGRKSGNASPTSSLMVSSDSRRAACDSAGEVTAQMLFFATKATFGPGWKPDADESKALPQAFADYYFATGQVNIPPWLQLAVVLAGYAIPRFVSDPETMRRIKFVGSKVGLIRKEVIPNADHPDNRGGLSLDTLR